MSNSPSLFHQGISEQRSFALYLGASLVCHAALMIMMIVLSGFSGCEKRAFSDGVIHVDLVSMQGFSDGGSGGGLSGLSAGYQPPAAGRAEFKEPVFEKPADPGRPAVSISEKEAPVDMKTSFKRKTFDSQRIVSSPVETSKGKPRKEEPADALADALSRLRETVDDNQRPGRGSGQGAATGPGPATGPGTGTGTGTGGGRRQNLTAINIYKVDIRYRILGNWVYSERLAGNDDGLRAVIGITIAEDGRILDIWYDERSGNAYFDDSTYKAVVKSDPLPKLPAGYSAYTVGLEFTPSGLKSSD